MSATVDMQQATMKERSAQATRELCQALGLEGVVPKNLQYLALALTEAAASEARRNPAFADCVADLYRKYLPPPPIKRGGTRTPRSYRVPTYRAVGTVDNSLIAPGTRPDPYAMLQLLGKDQLPSALKELGRDGLKEAVAVVQERHPGTRPTNMGQIKPMVDYILTHVQQL